MSLVGGANDWITESGQQVAHLFVEPFDHTLELQHPDILEREADYVFHVLWKFASQRLFLWEQLSPAQLDLSLLQSNSLHLLHLNCNECLTLESSIAVYKKG